MKRICYSLRDFLPRSLPLAAASPTAYLEMGLSRGSRSEGSRASGARMPKRGRPNYNRKENPGNGLQTARAEAMPLRNPPTLETAKCDQNLGRFLGATTHPDLSSGRTWQSRAYVLPLAARRIRDRFGLSSATASLTAELAGFARGER